MPNDLFYTSVQVHFLYYECLVTLYVLPCFIENPVFNANSVDPGQTPHSTASDRGLHFLPMSLLLDARRK